MRKTRNHQLNLTEHVRETSVSFNTSPNYIPKSRAATEARPEVSEMSPWHTEQLLVFVGNSEPPSHTGSKEDDAEMWTVRSKRKRQLTPLPVSEKEKTLYAHLTWYLRPNSKTEPLTSLPGAIHVIMSHCRAKGISPVSLRSLTSEKSQRDLKCEKYASTTAILKATLQKL